MMTYVTAFIFYTLAMIGILLIGFVVYKKVFENAKGTNNGLIRILDSSPINNKKLLLVVLVKNERFLIASGAEHTTFLSKLSNEGFAKKEQKPKETPKQNHPQETYENIPIIEQAQRYDDNKNTRAQELQKQFESLYEKEESQPSPFIKDRKKAVKQLLESLNFEENMERKSRSRF